LSAWLSDTGKRKVVEQSFTSRRGKKKRKGKKLNPSTFSRREGKRGACEFFWGKKKKLGEKKSQTSFLNEGKAKNHADFNHTGPFIHGGKKKEKRTEKRNTISWRGGGEKKRGNKLPWKTSY